MRFINLYADRLRYDTRGRVWLVWADGRWAPDHRGQVVELVRAHLRDEARQCGDGRRRRWLGCRRTVSAVERLARTDQRVAMSWEAIATAESWVEDLAAGVHALNRAEVEEAWGGREACLHRWVLRLEVRDAGLRKLAAAVRDRLAELAAAAAVFGPQEEPVF